jgi:hypothetical protein
MNAEKKESTERDGENKGEENKSGAHPFNPFDKSQDASSNRKIMEEEANAEQQRKETLTERD